MQITELSSIQVTIYVLLICSIICGIAALEEVYKKVIRNNKSARWENLLIGWGMTLIAFVLLVVSKVLIPVLNIIGAPLWMDYLLYIFGIFFLQLQVDMKVIKKLYKALITNVLKKANFTDEQIKDILNTTNSSK